MPNSRAHFLPFAALFLLAACAVPLGSGYSIEEQSVEFHYALETADRAHVRANYRLKNTGKRALSSLEILLPAEQPGGRLNLRVVIDGREITPEGAADVLTLPFQPAWAQGSRREVLIEYDLALDSPRASPGSVLHFSSGDWWPELLAPEGLFARGNPRADEVRMSIRLPEGFRALSSGLERGTQTRPGETEYRYLLRKDDFDPYLIAGRYLEQKVSTDEGTIYFWTLQPLPADQARQAGAWLAATMKTYETAFGPYTGGSRRAWIVESAPPGNLSPERDPLQAGSFPGGALLPAASFAGGVTEDSFLRIAERELARTWLRHLATPLRTELTPDGGRVEYEHIWGTAVVEYAARLAEQARSGEKTRAQQAAELLRRYDEARENAKEKPLAAVGRANSPEQQKISLSKGTLFFFALEDHITREKVARALKRMLQALRGDTWDIAELRAAMEAETGRDLAEFFRTWLNRTGIPEDFRARYAVPSEPGR